MIRILPLTACTALLFAGGHALAGDTMSRVTPTDQQLIKDCIEKQKASDVTMSKAAMKRFCKHQLEQQKTTGAPPEPPPTDSPQT